MEPVACPPAPKASFHSRPPFPLPPPPTPPTHPPTLHLLPPPQEDKELLRKELPNLRPECVRVMELATMLLKRGAEAGLTLYEIASILTRQFQDADEDASDLEKFALRAMQALEVGAAQARVVVGGVAGAGARCERERSWEGAGVVR